MKTHRVETPKRHLHSAFIDHPNRDFLVFFLKGSEPNERLLVKHKMEFSWAECVGDESV